MDVNKKVLDIYVASAIVRHTNPTANTMDKVGSSLNHKSLLRAQGVFVVLGVVSKITQKNRKAKFANIKLQGV